MAVPKKKKSLQKRKEHYNSLKYKRLSFCFYKECPSCNMYIKNHTYCNCVTNKKI